MTRSVNMLGRPKERLVEDWLSVHWREAHENRWTRRMLAEKAVADLGFAITESNIAGAGIAMGLTNWPARSVAKPTNMARELEYLKSLVARLACVVCVFQAEVGTGSPELQAILDELKAGKK